MTARFFSSDSAVFIYKADHLWYIVISSAEVFASAERTKILEAVKNAVRMEGITKHFGSVVANRDINLELHEGEILSLLGENGS